MTALKSCDHNNEINSQNSHQRSKGCHSYLLNLHGKIQVQKHFAVSKLEKSPTSWNPSINEMKDPVGGFLVGRANHVYCLLLVSPDTFYPLCFFHFILYQQPWDFCQKWTQPLPWECCPVANFSAGTVFPRVLACFHECLHWREGSDSSADNGKHM